MGQHKLACVCICSMANDERKEDEMMTIEKNILDKITEKRF